MSLKTLLMPAISDRLLSRDRLLRRRVRAEARRAAEGRLHEVHYFHQADDPYSALVAEWLPQFLSRYDITLVPHLVGPPPDAAAPDRQRLVAYSRRDADLLARHWGLVWRDPGSQPDPGRLEAVAAQAIIAIQRGDFADQIGPLSRTLWHGQEAGSAIAGLSSGEVSRHLAASNALRQRLGHYLGAMFYCEGEWYWGLDRIYHLEQRLQDAGAARPGVSGCMFAPEPDLERPQTQAGRPPIDFFVSLRSPYSAIVAPRVFHLGRMTGAQVRLRPVLPMVMRGLPVPREKRSYISLDAAREAHVRGIPFGRLNDPVGRPTERGLAVLALAESRGLGEAYLLSFMHGVWAEGVDAGSDRGLRRIVERAGLDWGEARQAVANPAWRQTAEDNRAELLSLGLWGVPSLRVGDTAVWGQDRLWAIQAALIQADQEVSR